MQQPCLQQATVKVHQLTYEDHAAQVLLSLGFQCRPEQSHGRTNATTGWYTQRIRTNYHIFLFSGLVLIFFLILEWITPLPAHSTMGPQPDLPTVTTGLLYGQ